MHSLFFFFLWKKKMLERNNLGKKEFTLTPSLNDLYGPRRYSSWNGSRGMHSGGVGAERWLPMLSLLSFYSAGHPSPWRDTSHLYGVSTRLPRRHGQVCLQYLDKVSTPDVQVCFQKPPSLSRLPNLFLSSLN